MDDRESRGCERRAGSSPTVRRCGVLLAGAALVLAVPAYGAEKPGVRPPVVAGKFYPEEAAKLSTALREFLSGAVPKRPARPLGLVVPHAGYLYSGQIAADGWRQVEGETYDVVVLLGTNHTRPRFAGMSVWSGGGFRTPLGVASVDESLARDLLAADPSCAFDRGVHEDEHSIEVQIPFVQTLLPGVKILPAVVGSEDAATCERLGRALARSLGGRRALVVASSDLSHYPSSGEARAADDAVLRAIASLDAGTLSAAIERGERAGRANLVTCACGEAPIRVALAAVRALGATRGTVLSSANSGDTSVGETDRVVGYGAVRFDAGPAGADVAALASPVVPADSVPLVAADRDALLRFARETIRRFLADGMAPLARDLPLSTRRPRGAFVTLLEHGELRGCIGHLGEERPLGQVVGAMALAAALQDPRFAPVEAPDLSALSIEISVLTPMQRVSGPGSIVVGRDGVVIRKAGRSAVFLPQVATEQGWDRTTLLQNLCTKAGLPADAWQDGAEFSTFQAIVFREAESQ